MGSIISSIAQERSWRIGHLRQQWLDMQGVVNLLIRQVKSDDFITVGVDADMKLDASKKPRKFAAFLIPSG